MSIQQLYDALNGLRSVVFSGFQFAESFRIRLIICPIDWNCLMGNWTTRGLPTRGLDNSRTSQLAEWTSRGLDNSRSHRRRQKNEN